MDTTKRLLSTVHRGAGATHTHAHTLICVHTCLSIQSGEMTRKTSGSSSGPESRDPSRFQCTCAHRSTVPNSQHWNPRLILKWVAKQNVFHLIVDCLCLKEGDSGTFNNRLSPEDGMFNKGGQLHEHCAILLSGNTWDYQIHTKKKMVGIRAWKRPGDNCFMGSEFKFEKIRTF